ncbi:hypothetical protein D3870_19515 [Noviherbaspirillum cavernae]|uniref:DUF2975 domain-containing protein n=2 Tax=Noviherbaspirillum cavernae TaxID=2320862 RepID=A0A418WWQ3_9BURK|nr:hypothetical protein D3870_19515 [Noviherbaspirillum cavernae]
MKFINRIFAAGYIAIIVLFFCCALALIVFAILELWHGIGAGADVPLRARFNSVVECVGLLTIAVAALELGQMILEEEVLRTAQMSAPTRVRRFLSRFMVVIIVSLSIECLVAVFQFIHDDPMHLPQASSIGVAAAVLLAAWGVFVKLNKSVEEIEPEAMKEAKSEDKKVST